MIQIYDLNAIQDQEIFLRRDEVRDVSAPVADIIRTVRAEGDRALYEYGRRFDGAELSGLSVTGAELEAALEQVEPEFLAVLREAADNIRAYHAKQKRESFVMTQRDGVILGQRILPLARVGIYVPGGTASYPSTVLMNAIPAQIAGVEDIVMVTPPGRDGAVSPAILAAAQVAGVTRIFKCGGAQAIAALAYGTESVPQVDKIVGPGNAYVAEAKKQVFGQVNIDMIAGPSEVLVLADGASNPAWVAADLLSQAEHDRMASAVLVTDSRALAEQVARELEVQLSRLERADIARESIERNGKIIVARSLEEGSRWPTASRRSTWSCVWTSPSTISARSGTRAPSFWGGMIRSPWGTILPDPTTPCPPWAPPGFTAPSRWTISSKNLSSATTPGRPWSGTIGRWGCSPAGRG